MTDAELLLECKKGLNIPLMSTAFDGVLTQKLLAVKAYMKKAGVSDEAMNNPLAVGVIVMGVGDLWTLGGGETKLSPAFHLLLAQLVLGKGVLTFSSEPADGAAEVPTTIRPTLTFDRRLASYSLHLKTYDAQLDVPFTAALDITGRVLTITPSSSLAAATKHAIIVEATAADGPSLGRTVLSFTTA